MTLCLSIFIWQTIFIRYASGSVSRKGGTPLTRKKFFPACPIGAKACWVKNNCSVSSVPVIGGRVRRLMSAKIKYADEDLGEFQVIPDFLPSPEDLAFKEDTVKVTISLSKGSVEFFKKEAKKHKTQYQKMIRRLLDVYSSSQQQPPTRRSTGRAKKRRAS